MTKSDAMKEVEAMPPRLITPLLTTVTRWAAQCDEILAVALLGSYARGEARQDSDIDLLILTTDPLTFRHATEWIDEIPWAQLGQEVVSWRDEDYGPLWSRRILLADGLEMEWGFAPPMWADLDPVDPGTRRVVEGGLRVLLDPTGIVHNLAQAVAPARRRVNTGGH